MKNPKNNPFCDDKLIYIAPSFCSCLARNRPCLILLDGSNLLSIISIYLGKPLLEGLLLLHIGLVCLLLHPHWHGHSCIMTRYALRASFFLNIKDVEDRSCLPSVGSLPSCGDPRSWTCPSLIGQPPFLGHGWWAVSCLVSRASAHGCSSSSCGLPLACSCTGCWMSQPCLGTILGSPKNHNGIIVLEIQK